MRIELLVINILESKKSKSKKKTTQLKFFLKMDSKNVVVCDNGTGVRHNFIIFLFVLLFFCSICFV